MELSVTGVHSLVLIMLLLIGAGLAFFWIYMEAYESSRPQGAILAYCDNEAGSDIEEQAM